MYVYEIVQAVNSEPFQSISTFHTSVAIESVPLH